MFARRSGSGEPRNVGCLKLSLRWYRLAAERGVAEAQFNLAALSPPGDAAAVSWFRLAAERGLAAAQFNLALRYRDGNGVNADNTTAYFWLTLAAAKQYPNAEAIRDRLAESLSPEEVEKARNLAVECLPTDAVRSSARRMTRNGQ